MLSVAAKSEGRASFLLSSFRAGGGEKQMVEIANALVARGFPVDVLAVKPVGDCAALIDSRVRVVSLDRGRIAFSLFPLVRYLRRERPAALLALDEYTHLLAIAARGISRVQTRVVLRIGNMLSVLFGRYEGFKNKILPPLVRLLYKRADAVIANSRGVGDDVARVTGISPKKVSVILNPKPLEEILRKAGEAVDHPWFGEAVPVVLFSGRLREQKNVPLLVRAFARIRAKGTSARLVIVGAGREEGRLRAEVEKSGFGDSVAFIGFASNPYPWMRRATVFVHPSRWDGMPNSVLEAMACGAPVISSDCSSGPREILAPESDYRFRLERGIEYAPYGVLFAVNDEDALAESLEKVLGDGEMRARYAEASRRRSLEMCSRDGVAEYIEALGL